MHIRARCQGVKNIKNANFKFRHTFFYVFLKIKVGLFSSTFWSEHSFICKFGILQNQVIEHCYLMILSSICHCPMSYNCQYVLYICKTPYQIFIQSSGHIQDGLGNVARMSAFVLKTGISSLWWILALMNPSRLSCPHTAADASVTSFTALGGRWRVEMRKNWRGYLSVDWAWQEKGGGT